MCKLSRKFLSHAQVTLDDTDHSKYSQVNIKKFVSKGVNHFVTNHNYIRPKLNKHAHTIKQTKINKISNTVKQANTQTNHKADIGNHHGHCFPFLSDVSLRYKTFPSKRYGRCSLSG